MITDPTQTRFTYVSKKKNLTSDTGAVLPGRKSDKDISKSDFYQTIFLPKIRLKPDPNSPF